MLPTRAKDDGPAVFKQLILMEDLVVMDASKPCHELYMQFSSLFPIIGGGVGQQLQARYCSRVDFKRNTLHSAALWRQTCHRLNEEQHHFCNVNMQTIVDDLAQSLIQSSNDKGKRVLVGLCGTPGSGKSQLARHVVKRINGTLSKSIAVVVGMDGWHLTRAQLAQMPDPQLAKDRRGAAWTFDDKVC